VVSGNYRNRPSETQTTSATIKVQTIRARLPPRGKEKFQIGTHWRQEQTQIIASAIGRPIPKAAPTVRVNAESRFTPGRALSIDMSLPPRRSRYRDECGDGFQFAPIQVQKVRFEGVPNMVNKRLR
jgi:hypothetical protein